MIPRARIAAPADIPELVRLINAAYRVEDFFINGDRTDTADVQSRIGATDACFIVIDDGEPGSLAGSVYVTLHGRRGHFGLLSVDPDRQGRGLGRSLVRAVEEHCIAAGCSELCLDYVNLREELPGFYERLGFVRTGETAPMPVGEKLKRPAHLVSMSRSLTPERPEAR